MRRTKKYTIDELIQKLVAIHGNKYDYSNVTEYHNNKQYIYPICKKHGTFKIRVDKHLQGQGCKKCAGTETMDTEKCVKLAKEIHGDRYDYHLVDCKGSHKLITIICPIHGEFSMTPHKHIYGKQGCRLCANEEISKRCRLSQNEIKSRILNLHPDWIIDTEFNYQGMYNEVKIKCPKHGYFTVTPSHVLHMRCGCPKCHKSKLEEDIEKMLCENNIRFEMHKTFEWLKFKRQQHLDFYLPDYKIAIECQGIQHFDSKGKYTMDEVRINKERDKNKWELCQSNGIKLIYYTNNGLDSLCDNDYMTFFTNVKDVLNEIRIL